MGKDLGTQCYWLAKTWPWLRHLENASCTPSPHSYLCPSVTLKNDHINEDYYSSPLSLSCLFVFPSNAFDLLSAERLIPSISTALSLDAAVPLVSPGGASGVDKPQLFLPSGQENLLYLHSVIKGRTGEVPIVTKQSTN